VLFAALRDDYKGSNYYKMRRRKMETRKRGLIARRCKQTLKEAERRLNEIFSSFFSSKSSSFLFLCGWTYLILNSSHEINI